MLNFTFYAPTKVHFGKTKMAALSTELQGYKKVLIVSGCGSVKRAGIFDIVIDEVKKADVSYCELEGVVPNPRLSKVYEGIEICRENECDLILAVGGGSVIDTAKAIAFGVKTDEDVWSYYDSHRGPGDALPVGVVLTVAATGSEMNGNSVITNEKTKDKRSCGSPVLIPEFSILNPEFTYSVDPYNTACGIADIMAHVFESYFSPIPDCAVQDYFAEGILKTCIEYGPTVLEEPDNYEARANIMWASTMALNGVTKLGKISDFLGHAIEHELSGLYDIAHGAGLAILFPNIMKVFLRDDTLDNFAAYAENVWGISGEDKYAIAGESIALTRSFFDDLQLPSSLNDVGIDNSDFELIAERAISRRGKVGRYKQLSKDDVMNVLNLSL